MSEDNLQESTVAPYIEASTTPQSSTNNQANSKSHSELSKSSQSLRDINLNNFDYNYYGTFDQQAMQSTTNSDSKACKKRDSTCSIRNGFIGKKHHHVHSKKCNGSNSKTSPSSQRNHHCPDAPRNTTSFLMADLEERNCRDVSPPTPSVSPTSTRTRCCSTTDATTPSTECPIAKLIPREDDDNESEFYDMVDTLSWERIDGLPREEINRQLIHIEEHNRDLMFHFTKLRQENDNLRQLLKANGIDLPQAAAATN